MQNNKTEPVVQTHVTDVSKTTRVGLIRNALAATTAHGWSRLVDDSGRIPKILWLLCNLAALTIFTVQTRSVVRNYLSVPTQTVMEPSGTNFMLPDVHFCSEIPTSMSTIIENSAKNVGNINGILHGIYNMSDRIFSKMSTIADKARKLMFLSTTLSQTIEFKTLSDLFGHQQHQFIVAVAVNGKNRHLDSFTKLNHHKYLNCFSFTATGNTIGSLTDQLKVTLFGDFSVVPTKEQPSIEGLPFSAIQMVGGYDSDKSAGLIMLVTPPGVYPDDSADRINLSTGFRTDIRLSMLKSTKYPDKPGKPCVQNPDDIHMVNPYTKQINAYRHSNVVCENRKKLKIFTDKCHCIPNNFFIPKEFATFEFCYNATNALAERNNMTWSKFVTRTECAKNVSNEELPRVAKAISKDCRSEEACEAVKYTGAWSIRQWPLSSLINATMANTVKVILADRIRQNFTMGGWERMVQMSETADEDTFMRTSRENFLEVTLSPAETRSMVVEERLSYDHTNLISDLGGNLGLFLGISVLTLCEIIDLVARELFYCR